jgi:hypothetical protein
MRTLAVLAMLLPGMAVAQPGQSLCSAREKIVFSCHLAGKTVSLCRPEQAPKQLTYRYGAPAHLELVYPARGAGGKGEFYTSSAPLVGGGETSVAFTRGAYEYGIYSRIGRAGGDPVFEDGIVIWRGGRKVRQLVCEDGGEGFREDISWLPERKAGRAP